MNKNKYITIMRKRIMHYKKLIETLEEKGFDFICLTELDVDEIGDLDIITDTKNFVKIANFLQNMGYSSSSSQHQQLLYSIYIENVGFLTIHLHKDFCFYGKCILLYKNIKQLSIDEIKYLLFLIESFYRLKFKKEKYEFFSKKCNIDEILKKIDIKQIFKNNINFIVKSYKKHLPPSKIDIFKRILVQNHIFFIWYMSKRYMHKIKRILHNDDIDIAIIGVDGAGKTTTINNLNYLLSKGAALYPQVIYSGLKKSWINRLREFFSKNKLNKNNFNNTNKDIKNKKLSLNQYIYQTIIVSLYILEFNIKYIKKKYILPKYTQTLWIYDRYYFDLMLYYNNKITKFLLSRFLIKPNYVIFLTGNIEKLYNRKKENHIGELKKYNDKYLHILNELKISYKTYDTTVNDELIILKEIQDVIGKLWKNEK